VCVRKFQQQIVGGSLACTKDGHGLVFADLVCLGIG